MFFFTCVQYISLYNECQEAISPCNRSFVILFITMGLQFIEWLVNEMARRDLSQAELARLSGLSQAMISHLISGKRQPGDATLRTLVRADLKTAHRRASPVDNWRL